MGVTEQSQLSRLPSSLVTDLHSTSVRKYQEGSIQYCGAYRVFEMYLVRALRNGEMAVPQPSTIKHTIALHYVNYIELGVLN